MKPQTMKQVRRVHHYIGVFFTPAILLFALSGALQTFRLQEEKGYGGTPPGWIVWMASIHKDSSLPRERVKHEDEKPAVEKTAERKEIAAPVQPSSSKLPLQIFVALLSIGLIISSLLGMAIALNNMTTRRTSIVMLAAGTALPLLLLLL
ncbi:hypothetical protein [Sphingomonas sp. GB1N7]|uniref:hypothetical protein n=1 Tax=Parasphingomonas caseinilytica TaxID=3096158 RepID=UPI002FC77B6C